MSDFESSLLGREIDQDLRLRALELAVAVNSRSHDSNDVILKRAQQFHSYIKTGYPRQGQGGVIEIGEQTYTNGQVINHAGINYYRACEIFIREYPDGSQSHCLKPRDHVSIEHEDVTGAIRVLPSNDV